MSAFTRVFEDSTFVGTMKGIIEGLKELQEHGYKPFINRFTIVVKNKNKEDSILLTSLEKKKRFNKACADQFKELKNVIEVGMKKQVVGRCNNLETLISCMNLIWTKAERCKLAMAQFFYSDEDKVRIYIDKLYHGLWNCYNFRKIVRARKVFIGDLVSSSKHKELQLVCEHCKDEVDEQAGQKKDRVMDNDFEVFIFARNCVQHLNEKQFKVLRKPGISPLMESPKLFLRFLESLPKDILNRVFSKSFDTMIGGRIKMIDLC